MLFVNLSSRCGSTANKSDEIFFRRHQSSFLDKTGGKAQEVHPQTEALKILSRVEMSQ